MWRGLATIVLALTSQCRAAGYSYPNWEHNLYDANENPLAHHFSNMGMSEHQQPSHAAAYYQSDFGVPDVAPLMDGNQYGYASYDASSSQGSAPSYGQYDYSMPAAGDELSQYGLTHYDANNYQQSTDTDAYSNVEGSSSSLEAPPAPVPRIRGSNRSGFGSKAQMQEELNKFKAKVEELWSRKGLWVGMIPRQLAIGVGEIKLELGRANYASVGQITGFKIRNHPLSQGEYREDFVDWTSRVTKKINHLERRFLRREPHMSQEQMAKSIYITVRNVRARDDNTSAREERSNEGKASHDALSAWKTLVEHVIEPAYGKIPEEQIPMEAIEVGSRQLHEFLPLLSREEIGDSLIRYMLTRLDKTPVEVDVFSKARNEWLQEVHFLENIRI